MEGKEYEDDDKIKDTDTNDSQNAKLMFPILSKSTMSEFNELRVVIHMIQMDGLFELYIRSRL